MSNSSRQVMIFDNGK
jgi:hypothetical protein